MMICLCLPFQFLVLLFPAHTFAFPKQPLPGAVFSAHVHQQHLANLTWAVNIYVTSDFKPNMSTSFLTELLPIAWELFRDAACTSLGDFPFCDTVAQTTLMHGILLWVWVWLVCLSFWFSARFFALDSHKENIVLILFLLGTGGSKALLGYFCTTPTSSIKACITRNYFGIAW